MLGRKFVDKQNSLHEFVQACLLHTPLSLYYLGFRLLLCPICQGSAVHSNPSSTIPKVSGDRVSGPCLCCRRALSRRFDIACVDRDIDTPARSVENILFFWSNFPVIVIWSEQMPEASSHIAKALDGSFHPVV